MSAVAQTTAPLVTWISVADAAERLSVTVGRISHLIADGRLVSKMIHPRHADGGRGRLHVRAAGVAALREPNALAFSAGA